MADEAYPPPIVEYPEDFVPNQEMINMITQTLSVDPEWAKQGTFYADNPGSFDEVCAWVLENHPRFVVVSSSNSPPPTPDSASQWKMAFIVNAKLYHRAGEVAERVAQAMMEFCIKYQADETLPKWREEGSYKCVLAAENSESLYKVKAIAEAHDLIHFYLTDGDDYNKRYQQAGSAEVTILVLFGDREDVEAVTEGLQPV